MTNHLKVNDLGYRKVKKMLRRLNGFAGRHLKVIELSSAKVNRVRRRLNRSVEKTYESEWVGLCES